MRRSYPRVGDQPGGQFSKEASLHLSNGASHLILSFSVWRADVFLCAFDGATCTPGRFKPYPPPNLAVRVLDPASRRPTRIGFRYTDEGEKVRVALRSSEQIPRPAVLSERRRPLAIGDAAYQATAASVAHAPSFGEADLFPEGAADMLRAAAEAGRLTDKRLLAIERRRK